MNSLTMKSWLLLTTIPLFQSCCASSSPHTSRVANGPTGFVAYRKVGNDVELTFIEPANVPENIKQRVREMLSSAAPLEDKVDSLPGLPASYSREENRRENSGAFTSVVENPAVIQEPLQTASDYTVIDMETPAAPARPSAVQDVKPVLQGHPEEIVESNQASRNEPQQIQAGSATHPEPHILPESRSVGEHHVVISSPSSKAKQADVGTPGPDAGSPPYSQKLSATTFPKSTTFSPTTTTRMMRSNQTEPSVAFETTQKKTKGALASSENGAGAVSFIIPLLISLILQVQMFV